MWYHHDMKTTPPFKKTEQYGPRSKKERRLLKAFTLMKTEGDMAAFLRDLLTVAEITEFANRLEIVMLLQKGYSYQKIAAKTGVSTTTVTRVAHWLFRGCGGYQKVIDKLT